MESIVLKTKIFITYLERCMVKQFYGDMKSKV